jgi:hypothetical protein
MAIPPAHINIYKHIDETARDVYDEISILTNGLDALDERIRKLTATVKELDSKRNILKATTAWDRWFLALLVLAIVCMVVGWFV